jgi:hypothetical protein
MRLPRMRFTVRRMMIVVVGVGLLTGVGRAMGQRSARFRMLSEKHWAEHWDGAIVFRSGDVEGTGPDSGEQNPAIVEIRRRVAAQQVFHRRMAEKYERAARYPWLGVEPDPPEPKSLV